MRNKHFIQIVMTALVVVSCQLNQSKMAPKDLQPPIAETKEKFLEIHGDVRMDPY